MDGGGVSGDVGGARIGPNAITQLVAVLDRVEERAFRDQVMAAAGVAAPDPNLGMIPEADAAAMHLAVRMAAPERAEGLLRLAGLETGRYILRHRIPPAAQWAIRALPSSIGARVLAKAIARHSWTFAGSGTFDIAGWQPLVFAVWGNPLVAGLRGKDPVCHWHAAVFEQLFSCLVYPGCVVREVSCIATGGAACRFEVHPCG